MSWWMVAGAIGALAGTFVTMIWHVFLRAEESLAASDLGIGQGSLAPLLVLLVFFSLLLFANRLSAAAESFARLFYNVHYRQGKRSHGRAFFDGLIGLFGPLAGACASLEGVASEWTAAIASKFGEFARLTRFQQRSLLVCAVGSVLSAQMASPFFGVMFILEVVFAWSIPSGYLGPLLVSSFAAVGLSQGLIGTGYFLGAVPGVDAGFSYFLLDGSYYLSLPQLVLMTPLALVVSIGFAAAFIWMIAESENLGFQLAKRVPLPPERAEALVRIGAWAVLTALILTKFPPLLGLGRELLIPNFWQHGDVFVLAGVLLVRFFLVGITILAFRSVISVLPILFLGLCLGYFLYPLTQMIGLGGETVHAWGLLLACGVFSGIFGAPATACILAYFLVGVVVADRGFFLLAVTIISFGSHYLIGLLFNDRLSTMGLHRLGLRFRSGLCMNAHSHLTVRDAMYAWIEPIGLESSLATAYAFLLRSKFTVLPVVNQSKELVGMLSLAEFENLDAWRAMEHDSQIAELLGIEDIMQPLRRSVPVTMQLDEALYRMRGDNFIPVTEVDSQRFLGLLMRSELESVYHSDVLKRLVSEHRSI